MFNNRLFRTSEELDFLRGPMLAAYLRFEIILWGLIAVLALIVVLGQNFLPSSSSIPAGAITPQLLLLLGFSLGVVIVFIAVWRFKKWGVLLLALWTLVMVAGLLAALFSPPVDLLALLALLGLIVARGMILWFEIRPRWRYFEAGIF
jgi:hypothetical protein